jgi:prevent-host-death family protein
MTVVSCTAARNNLADIMNKVCADHDPVIITRRKAEPVVILSLEDYESLQKTRDRYRTGLIPEPTTMHRAKTLQGVS